MLKNVDQSVYKLFPDYQGTDWIDKKYENTIRHPLSMTSGIEWDECRDEVRAVLANLASDKWLMA